MRTWAMALAMGLAVMGGSVRSAESLRAGGQPGVSAALADTASSSREARRRAADAVPLDRMPDAHRRLAERTLRSATLFRRLATETVTCDPALLEFVLEKPEVLVDLWRALGISRLTLDPAAAGEWRMSDGYGTTGVVRLLHSERTAGGGMFVFYGQGGYTGPLAARPLTGCCLVVVRHTMIEPDAQGRRRHDVHVDAFLDVDGLGLELVTRTLQPLITRSAAANLHEICLFIAHFSAAAHRSPAGVERIVERMNHTPPQDRHALARLAAGGRAATAFPVDPPEQMQAELAARWLPADQLQPSRR